MRWKFHLANNKNFSNVQWQSDIRTAHVYSLQWITNVNPKLIANPYWTNSDFMLFIAFYPYFFVSSIFVSVFSISTIFPCGTLQKCGNIVHPDLFFLSIKNHHILVIFSVIFPFLVVQKSVGKQLAPTCPYVHPILFSAYYF